MSDVYEDARNTPPNPGPMGRQQPQSPAGPAAPAAPTSRDEPEREERQPFPNRPEIVPGKTDREKKMHTAMSEEDKLLGMVVENMAKGYTYWNEIYDLAHDDLEFCYDEQWDRDIIAERQRDRRPMLTINTLPQNINLVTGAARRSRFSIKVLHSSGPNDYIPAADPMLASQGVNYSVADVMGGIVRDIEARSNAKAHYIASLNHSTESGFGFMRIDKVRPPDDPLNVELRISHVPNRFSVMIDPFAQQPDKRDMRWCAVSHKIPREDFEKLYGDRDDYVHGSYLAAESGTLGTGMSTGFRQWWADSDRDEVRIVEYWWKDPVKRTICRYKHPDGQELHLWRDDFEDIFDELVEVYGFEKISEHEVDTWDVKVMQCTDSMVLEGPSVWGGFDIPIVMVAGRSVNMDDKDHYFGLVRYAQDPQRMVNYWMSQATESVGSNPRTKYIASTEQIAGHEDDWANASSGSSTAVLPYNFTEPNPNPPIPVPPNGLPAAEFGMVNVAADFMKQTTGLYEANLGQPSNEVSGRAIQSRQQSGATGTFEFQDNLAAAVQRIGEILCGIIPLHYTEPNRLQRLVMDDETETHVRLNYPIQDRRTGRAFLVGHIGLSRYGVVVTTGPSFLTQRQEFVDIVTEISKTSPMVGQLLMPDILLASDLPFARRAAEKLTRATTPYELWPDEMKRRYPQPEPSPQEQLESDIANAESEADLATAQAKRSTAQTQLETNRIKLETQRSSGDTQLQVDRMKIEMQRLQNEYEAMKLRAEAAEAAMDPDTPEFQRAVKSQVADSLRGS